MTMINNISFSRKSFLLQVMFFLKKSHIFESLALLLFAFLFILRNKRPAMSQSHYLTTTAEAGPDVSP